MNRVIKHWLDILAVGGSVLGSLLVATNRPELGIMGYMAFLVGSSASVALLRKSNVNRSMVWLNIYYVAVNFLGLIVRSI